MPKAAFLQLQVGVGERLPQQEGPAGAPQEGLVCGDRLQASLGLTNALGPSQGDLVGITTRMSSSSCPCMGAINFLLLLPQRQVYSMFVKIQVL